MALFDFLKRKKEIEKAKGKKPSAVNVAEKKEQATKDKKPVKSDKKKQEVNDKKPGLKGKGFSYDVVKEPHISEKATYLAEDNKYIFTIYQSANKMEIKKSVEGIYGVNVLSVNIIRIPHKKRRIGKTEGFKKGYRKAIVTIKEGQKIETF